MSDKPKVKIRSSGFKDVSIELPNGTDLVKYLHITKATLDFGIDTTKLNIECIFVDDELDLDVEQVQLEGAKFEIIHRYPKEEERLNELVEQSEQRILDHLRKMYGG